MRIAKTFSLSADQFHSGRDSSFLLPYESAGSRVYKKVPKEKNKLPKRSNKGHYDNQVFLRHFVGEKYREQMAGVLSRELEECDAD